MAVNPENFFNGNGSTTLFSFTFEYLEESDVKVSVDGVVKTQTTDYTFANATTISFNTAPASGTDNIRIYRDTNVDALKATFFPGSAIRADDLNDNLTQNNYAVQEIKAYYWDNETDTIHSNETWVSSDSQIATTAAMDARFQDEATETIESGETWVSDNDHIATTAAIDARFQDELDETITSSETWPDNDDTIATTAAIDNRIDTAITNDIGTDGTGITVTDDGDGTITLGLGSGSIDLDRIKDADIITSAEANPNNDTTIATTAKIDDMIDAAITGDIAVDSTGLTLTNDGDGTITLGIGSSSVDLDRIKNDDIITYAEQNAGSPSPADTNIFTASAAARRFDTLVQTGTPSGSDWETGKTWLQNDTNLTLSVWNGSAWTGITSGGTFTNQPKVVYVDATAGDNNNDGHRISRPKLTIKAAVEQINAEINTSITNGGSGYVDSSYTNVPLTGGNGTGLQANITVSGGVVTAATVTSTTTLQDYSIGNVLSASNADLGGSGSGFQLTVGGDGDGQVVIVAAGVYQEAGPIQIKRRNVSIIGQALRSCIVHPTVATQGDQSDGNHALFELNSGSYIANLTLTGMKAGSTGTNTLDSDLPIRQGWNFAFYEDAFITKSPYIQNCTNFSDSQIDNSNLNSHNPAGGQAGDTTSAPTGGGMLINGSAPHDDSPLRSMVADSYTHVGLNGPGVLVVNNGYAQITSSYAFFNRYHIKCLSGGQANLAASTTDFGNQALVADGRSTNAVFTSTTIAAAADQATEFFIDGPTARTATPLPWHGTDTRPQSNMLVDIGGNTYPILSSSNVFTATEIISGRTYTIVTVGGTDFTAIGAASNTVGVTFTATGVGTGSGTVTDSTGYRVSISRPNPNNRSQNLGLNGAVASSSAVSFFLRSQVASSGHTMEYVGSGTNYTALPENGGVPDETRQITELNNGKVWTAVTDHNGKFKVGGNQTDDPFFEVDQQLGFVTIPTGSIAFNLVSDLSPQLGANLDVNGNTITGLSNPTANDEVANKAYVDATAGSPTQIVQLNTSVVTSDTGSDGTITFTTDGTTAMTVDNNQRVGIGTTSPSEKLTVDGGITARNTSDDSQLKLQHNGTIASISATYGSTGAYDPLAFFTSDTERARIDSSGRLLVGTSSTTAVSTLLLENNSLGANRQGVLLFARGEATPSDGAALGTLAFAASNHSSAAEINVRRDGGTWTAGSSQPTRLEFSTTADGASSPTERMRIDSSGNLGIGTTPSSKLEILNGSDSSVILTLNGADKTSEYLGLGINGSDAVVTAGGNGSTSTNLVFRTAASGTESERARIDSSGRLGLGTSSPAEKLHLSGASSWVRLDATATGGGNFMLGSSEIGGSRAFSIYDVSGSAYRLSINSSGNVGIGTTSPGTYKLNISGAYNEDGLRVFAGASGYGNPLVVGRATGGEALRVDNGGRLLVGTSTATSGPKGQFAKTVVANYNGGSGTAYLALSNDKALTSTINNEELGVVTFSARDADFATITGVADGTPASGDTPGRLVFSTTADGASSPTERMRITRNGNVFINSTINPALGTEMFGVAAQSSGQTTAAGFANSVNTAPTLFISNSSDTTNTYHVRFASGSGGTTRGEIYYNGSQLVYATSSDYRLKENVEPLSSGVDLVKQLRPVSYRWIESQQEDIGFIAHEVQEIFPNAVGGDKDAVDENGAILPQTYDPSKLVPLLTAALQEALAEIESLKARVTALEP